MKNKKNTQPIIRTKIEELKTIDSFVRRIKEENIHYMSIDNRNIIHQGIINKGEKGKETTLYLGHKNILGHGYYGTTYHIGNFVIKVPFYDAYTFNPQTHVNRCSHLLNELNRNNNFSRPVTLNSEKNILVSKYISGENIIENEAYDFVKQRGRILFDYSSKGNVKIDSKGKKYVIDTDLTAQPTGLKRYPSLGTITIKTLYKDIFIEQPLKSNEIEPLYYSQIKHRLPK